ncbi:MAG TPA: hypothetical protein VFI15_02150 [Candidatus Limnocylindrales bacterium]|nr:hypothetical protein [Candidatus Limnocylindrales bacterium]
MPALDTVHRAVPAAARLRLGVISGVSRPAVADPEHARAWADVSGGDADWADVYGPPNRRERTGPILFRAWRISRDSWAWQTPAMPAPAFARYGDGLRPDRVVDYDAENVEQRYRSTLVIAMKSAHEAMSTHANASVRQQAGSDGSASGGRSARASSSSSTATGGDPGRGMSPRHGRRSATC